MVASIAYSKQYINMSSNFCKSEISNIASEMIRIVDKINEPPPLGGDNDFEWPPYCENEKPPEISSRTL